MQVGRQINKISNYLRRRSQKTQEKIGLTNNQALVLDYIMASNCPVYQKDIEKEFDLRSSSATELIGGMEEKGWIERIVSPSDKRLKQIVFKDNSDVVRNSIKNEICTTEKQLIKGINKKDLEVFMKVTNQMLKNLEEEDEQ